MKFKGPNSYACKIGHKLVQFTSNGTYTTDDKDLIDVLSKLSHISILEGKVETKKEVKKEIIEEVKEEVVSEEEVIEEYTLEEVSNKYFEKFDKKVPNNKKNDIDWIKSKLD